MLQDYPDEEIQKFCDDIFTEERGDDMSTDYGILMDYDTGVEIGYATQAQAEAGLSAMGDTVAFAIDEDGAPLAEDETESHHRRVYVID